jgi:2-dehydro-3-deoxyphosphogluconate aldolase/(4S)-4-hydroxy-2-oxoglutarate aldolase
LRTRDATHPGASGACAVAVGSELVDAKTIKEGKYEVFTERAR